MASNSPLPITEKHLEFCGSDAQRQKVEAYLRAGTIRGAARETGCAYNAVQEALSRVMRRASLGGYAPGHFTAGVAPGYIMGKVTVERKQEDGTRTWERQSPEIALLLARAKEGIAGFLEDVKPVSVSPAPLIVNSDIIPWIQIGDGHFGMLAHEAETGENFDLKIAEREMIAAIEMAVEELPPVERLVVQDMGDFTHYENMGAKTDQSGHDLDYDGRFPKMIRVYSRTFRRIIALALTKAQTVDVIINQGNHSRTNDFWMRELLDVAYGPTGRVNVLNNDSVFIGYRMGKTFVMCHHSDKCRPAQLGHVMATDFAKDWGETTFRFVDIGHIHHNMVCKEHPGVTVESFNQLAAPDKYAHDGGWRARRCLTIVMRSRTYGEIGRRTIPVEQVRDRIFAALPDGTTLYRPTGKQAFVA